MNHKQARTGNIFLRIPLALNHTLAQGKSIIITGEQGCGKGLAAHSIQSQFIKYDIDEYCIPILDEIKYFHRIYITHEAPPFPDPWSDLMYVTSKTQRRTNGDIEIEMEILHPVVEIADPETRQIEIMNGIALSEKKRLGIIETFKHCKKFIDESTTVDQTYILKNADPLLEDIDRWIGQLNQERKTDGQQ